MATIKSYTDFEQSKILSKILSSKTADLWWAERFEGRVELNGDYIVEDTPYYYLSLTRPSYNNYSQDTVKDIPCWSLAALLSVLPVSCDDGQHCLALINSNPNGEIEWLCSYEDNNGNLMMECYADNQVDACVEMILKLHERKML